MIKPSDLLAILNKVNPNFELKMEKSTKRWLFLDILVNRTWGEYVLCRPTHSKDVCALRQITFGVASETFHFVGLRESALLLKKKTQN